MNFSLINSLNDISNFFIIRLTYNVDGLNTALYFSNNKFYPEKSFIRENKARIFNIITNEWEIINTNSITGYFVQDVSQEKVNNPLLSTDEDIENQRNLIFEKINVIKNNIEKRKESFEFIKSYMSEEQYNSRFDIEFEKNISNKDEYLKKLIYNKIMGIGFNYWFISKKLGVPEDWVNGRKQLTKEELDIFKEKWKNYLIEFVKYFVGFLNKEIEEIDNSDETYKEDLKTLINEVEEEIKTIHFADKTEVTDILKVWPTLIAPAPFFLEDLV